MLTPDFTDSIMHYPDLRSLERLSLFMSEISQLKLEIPNFFGFDAICAMKLANELKIIMAKFKQIIDRADITHQAKRSFAVLSDEHKSCILNICLHLTNNLEFKQLEILCRLSARQIDQLHDHDLVHILDEPRDIGIIDTSIRLKNYIKALLPELRPSSATSSLGRNNSVTVSTSSTCRSKTP